MPAQYRPRSRRAPQLAHRVQRPHVLQPLQIRTAPSPQQGWAAADIRQWARWVGAASVRSSTQRECAPYPLMHYTTPQPWSPHASCTCTPQPWSPHASSTGKGYAADGHPPRCYSLYTRATPSSPIACAKPAMLCPAGQPPYRGVGGTVPCRLSWAGWCSRRPGIAHRSGCLHRCSVPAGSKVRNLTLCILPMLCMG